MKLKLKKTIIILLCIMLFASLLCGCGKEKINKEENNSTSENAIDESKYNKEEYVARIKAYKEYYEGIENTYYSVNGAILVHEDGMPYMVLCCALEQDVDIYKIQLIDYKDGSAELCGEKEFNGGENEYGDNRSCDVDLAFLDDRCIMRVEINGGEYSTEYWEFIQGNLLAQKLSDEEIDNFKEEMHGLCYVYDISEKPYEYIYTYDNGKISIYDKESNIDTVNNIAVQKLQDYMQLSDEQKEYFVYEKKRFSYQDNTYELIAGVNICTFDNILIPLSFWGMEGVTFKQCLNELINEPLYRIEDLMIKEYDYIFYNDSGKYLSDQAEEKKEEKLKELYEKMPKYNPYDTDKQLLGKYYGGIREICVGKGVLINAGGYTIDEKTLPYVPTDLATLMGMYNVTQALDVMFEESPLKYDYIFTSDEFKGATWKDITFNGSHKYPVLTLSKNGNVMSYSVFDNYVEFRENTELKRAIEAYAAFSSDDYEYAFAYIDEDDIPEMIVSLYNYQHGAFTNEFYSYKDGELIRVGFSPDMRFDGYLPKQNSIAIFVEDYFYEEDGTSYKDGKYTQYSIIDNDFKYVKDIELTGEYESVTFEKDIISALGKIYSLRNE